MSESLPFTIINLMTSLTPKQIADLPPAQRQALSNECERIYREINATRIIADARDATAPKTGILASLKDGERSL